MDLNTGSPGGGGAGGWQEPGICGQNLQQTPSAAACSTGLNYTVQLNS